MYKNTQVSLAAAMMALVVATQAHAGDAPGKAAQSHGGHIHEFGASFGDGAGSSNDVDSQAERPAAFLRTRGAAFEMSGGAAGGAFLSGVDHVTRIGGVTLRPLPAAVPAVPEPSSVLMLLAGIGVVGMAVLRRKHRD
ncbi:PEP-CTERM sorting domain-containing protein [Chitinivorax sp. PXF-14]|uniref:PEP-CTERM sorting domain-containing protein n=1 Tax=Chitinivorax sp. PXF-14 TaxID=3230488 RepID=UPI003466BB44